MWHSLWPQFLGELATTSITLIASWHIQEIIVLFSVCCLVDRVVSPQISSYLFPGRFASMNLHTKTQWNIRVVALLQSFFISVLTLWVLITDEERASMASTRERLLSYSKNVGMINGYSMGYYLWDLAAMIQNPGSFSVGMLLHSVCAFALLSVCTVSVHFRSQPS